MSFEINSFQQIGPGGSGPRMWVYNSPDSISVITAANYFLPAISLIGLNDVIIVVSSTESMPQVNWTYCNENTGLVIDVVDGLVVPSTSDAYMRIRSQNENVNAGQTMTVMAPALVHFDATNYPALPAQTTDRWDYGNTGPSGAGSWSYPSSQPAASRLKNEHAGAGGLSAALYEDPGTFTVQHKKRLIDTTEITSQDTTIIVQDPDVFYAGANTIALHYGGNVQVVAANPTGLNQFEGPRTVRVTKIKEGSP